MESRNFICWKPGYHRNPAQFAVCQVHVAAGGDCPAQSPDPGEKTGDLSPLAIRNRILAARKLPDDPGEPAHRRLAVPSVTDASASLLGNQTAIRISPNRKPKVAVSTISIQS